ncbi:hypothetical protein BTZ20_3497 [Rhodococcus sp. MTM3W5.2]|nr:hypothetical protein BTZ20_3497 [Rhodococcus sp. MTM3W5.2]
MCIPAACVETDGMDLVLPSNQGCVSPVLHVSENGVSHTLPGPS